MGGETALKLQSSLVQILTRNVFPETVALVAVCVFDMASTLIAVRSGRALEANPVLSASLQNSNAAFIILKTASYLGPLILLELIGRYRPEMTRNAIRACLFGYICLYVIGVVSVRAFHPAQKDQSGVVVVQNSQ